MMRFRTQKGYLLMVAIFLLVILGMISAVGVSVGSASARTNTTAQQSVRAYWAARTALEWGFYQVADSGTCFSTTTLTTLSRQSTGFRADVTCNATDHAEDNTQYRVFTITARSYWNNALPHPLFASRSVSGTYLYSCDTSPTCLP